MNKKPFNDGIVIDVLHEEEEVIRHEEFTPLFEGHHNPNHDIFVVPTQEGADKDDQWNGSIGDATMEHIWNQRHRMHEMEHFVYTPNGNIFRTEFNVAPPDEDGERALKKQQIDVMTAPSVSLISPKVFSEDDVLSPDEQALLGDAPRISRRVKIGVEEKEAVLAFLREEVELAREARAEKQDAMDQVLVPFEDWEMNPQMTNAVDIPSTPPVMYIYAGNASQMFYDWVAEDHPDLRLINSFLSIANNIDWDHFNVSTVDYFEKWLYADGKNWSMQYVPDRLLKLCQDILATTTKTPSELACEALSDIEKDWFDHVVSQAINNFKSDPVASQLIKFEETLKDNRKAGRLSWKQLGEFGQALYEKHSSRMSTAHWAMYKALKKKYAPEVRIGKVDVNRANLNKLREFFKARFQKRMDEMLNSDMSDEKYEREVKNISKEVDRLASQVYFNTPYMTLEDLAKQNLISIDDVGYTDSNVILISLVKKAYRESLNFRDLGHLYRASKQIVAYQKKHADKCTEQEWYAVWQAYRIAKTSAAAALGITLQEKTQEKAV